VNYVKLDYKRWVNNNDIVTRVPPPWLGYRHTGTEIYINSRGIISKITGWKRTKDRFRGFFRGLRKFQIDHFSDHSTFEYIGHIVNAICKEEGITEEQLYAQGPQSDL
jgi:triacylglycerol lipase